MDFLNECERICAMMAAYRDGWMDRGELERLQAHLSSCARCADEAQRDALLCRMLAGLPEVTPKPADWSRIYASHLSLRRTKRRRWGSFFAFATTAAALMILHLHRSAPHGGEHIVLLDYALAPASISDTDLARDAHALVSAADTTGDPNRAMILLHAPRSESESERSP